MDETEPAPTPLIYVKIADSVELAGADRDSRWTLDELVAATGIESGDAVTAIRSVAPDIAFAWAFPSLSASDIAEMTGASSDEEENAGYTPPKLDHFLEVAPMEGVDSSALADTLGGWSGVIDYAYVADLAIDAAVNAPSNPLYSATMQGYLGAAPGGIDAPAAWAKGADGSDTRFIDIEQGWFLTHDDLPQTISVLAGSNRKTSFAHGCAVLGEVVGVDNTTGIVGIAPSADAQVMSYNDDQTSDISFQRLADRILAASKSLFFGQVLLLEVQLQNKATGTTLLVPAESDPLVFEAIRLATKLGTIVVEAGGNGTVDLDAWVMDKGPDKGKHTLSRDNTSEFKDSVAIMVGAAEAATNHPRERFSNHGSRIDCFAWGENIVTTGWNSSSPTATDQYWGIDLKDSSGTVISFARTSGASPIIVGSCLLLQHLRVLLNPVSGSGKLGPFGMRRILANFANGTPSSNGAGIDGIGVMPDFTKIIANEFQP